MTSCADLGNAWVDKFACGCVDARSGCVCECDFEYNNTIYPKKKEEWIQIWIDEKVWAFFVSCWDAIIAQLHLTLRI